MFFALGPAVSSSAFGTLSPWNGLALSPMTLRSVVSVDASETIDSVAWAAESSTGATAGCAGGSGSLASSSGTATSPPMRITARGRRRRPTS